MCYKYSNTNKAFENIFPQIPSKLPISLTKVHPRRNLPADRQESPSSPTPVEYCRVPHTDGGALWKCVVRRLVTMGMAQSALTHIKTAEPAPALGCRAWPLLHTGRSVLNIVGRYNTVVSSRLSSHIETQKWYSNTTV